MPLLAWPALAAAASSTWTVCAVGCDHPTLAVALAAAAPGDVLELLDPLHVEADTVVIDRAITLRGAGSTLALGGVPGIEVAADDVRIEGLALDPLDGRRAIDAFGVSGLALADLVASGHTNDQDGGVARFDGFTEATVERCTFEGNHTDGAGGVLAVLGGATVTVAESVFVGNTASGDGGAIRVDDAALTVLRSTFTGDTAGDDGGAIAVSGILASLAVYDSVFEGNQAADGAAIAVAGADWVVATGNRFCLDAAGDGGIVSAGALAISWIDNVHRDGAGIALLLEEGEVTVHDCDVLGNHGGLQVVDAEADVRNVLFGWNGPAPAVEVVDEGTVTLAYDAFWANAADTVGLPLGPGAVTTDPLVAYTPGACEEDLARDPASPLLGAGDPALDPDIGAAVAVEPPPGGTTTTPPTTPTGGTTTTGGTLTPPAGGPDRTAAAPVEAAGAAGCGCRAGAGPHGLAAALALALTTRAARRRPRSPRR